MLGSLGSSVAGSLANSLGLLTLRHDLLPGGTDNGTLDLGSLADTLLGHFFGGTLFVEAAVKDGPVVLAWVLLFQKVGLAFAVQETKGFRVPSNKQLSMARIDFGSGKVADFRPKRLRKRKDGMDVWWWVGT